MNYHEFMSKLDLQLTSMSKDEFITWIKLKAANVNVTDRDAFLQSLQVEKNVISLPDVNWKEIKTWCAKIDKGEHYFFKRYNEEYDDWYDDIDEEYEIEDPYKIMDMICDMLYKGRQFAFAKDYESALALYHVAFQRKYTIQSEYGDINEVGVLELLSEIEHKPYEDLSLFSEYCFLNYKVSTVQSLEAIYELRKQEHIRSKLEDAFSSDFGMLEDTIAIMHAWVDFLATKNDEDSELLYEALIYDGNLDVMIDFCNNHAENFPTLFHLCVQQLFELSEYEKCEALCRNGIRSLDHKKRIRSKTMDIGAMASEKLNHNQNKIEFVLEAFRSDSTPERCLMLMKVDADHSMLEEAYQIANALPLDRSFSLFHHQENTITNMDLCMIRFLHGDFEELLHEMSLNEAALGWSNQPVQFIVCAFLILLGQCQMPENIKKRLLNYGGIDDKENIMISWFKKQKINHQKKHECITVLMHLIDRRTDAILEGKHRKSYNKAALLNIGLQYAFDALHMKLDAKKRCKDRHSRRPAFYQEWDEICRY